MSGSRDSNVANDAEQVNHGLRKVLEGVENIVTAFGGSVQTARELGESIAQSLNDQAKQGYEHNQQLSEQMRQGQQQEKGPDKGNSSSFTP